MSISRYYNKSGERIIKFQSKVMRHPLDREFEMLNHPLTKDEDRYHSSMTQLRMFLYEEEENDNAR